MSETFSFSYFGSTITARSLGTDLIPELAKTITSHCIPVTTDDKIVAVTIIGRGIDIPGGHIDEGETAEDAMRRETLEEAYTTVGTPVLIDVLELSSDDKKIGLDEKPYMLMYAARVQTIEAFIPNEEVSERTLLTPDEFVAAYFGDKEYARETIDVAIATLNGRGV